MLRVRSQNANCQDGNRCEDMEQENGKERDMSADFESIKQQSKFCTDLMTRLNDEIQKSGNGTWSGMADHTRKQDDIKRIRRELMDLSKKLNPWW